ncbi:MAG: LON peptidase substrate-binding domain-containing protein [Casimicrobiaceae bacterium]
MRKAPAAHEANVELPLFPLHATLFPGGRLTIKVFGASYYALAKRCITEGSGFGVVTLTGDPHVGTDQRFARVGTYVTVASFDAPAPDRFLLAVRGVQRFAILDTATDASGLPRARIRWLPNEADVGLPAEHAELALLVRRLVEQLGEERFPKPHHFDSGSWVGSRLAELMQMPPTIKQAMLEINDPVVRLRTLAQLLNRGKLTRETT